jgi:hypothetical protein
MKKQTTPTWAIDLIYSIDAKGKCSLEYTTGGIPLSMMEARNLIINHNYKFAVIYRAAFPDRVFLPMFVVTPMWEGEPWRNELTWQPLEVLPLKIQRLILRTAAIYGPVR